MHRESSFSLFHIFASCLLLAATTLILSGCGSDRSKELTPEQQQLRMGKDLFSKSCSSCHGALGSGAGSRNGPSLQGTDYSYGNDHNAVFSSIHDGRSQGMPAFSSVYTKAQIEALTAYVLYLQQ